MSNLPQYPRMGPTRKVRPQGLCQICGMPRADRRITIEWNWFRGDDTVHKVHELCIAAMDSKDVLSLLTNHWS